MSGGHYLSQLQAAAFVTGATGVALFSRGITTVRTGAGVYTLTLSTDLDANEHVPSVSLLTTDMTWFYTNTSDTVKTVTTRTAVPADGDTNFYVALWGINP